MKKQPRRSPRGLGPAEPLTFRPVTRSRLPDLARFAANNGKFGYCSCMRWRLTSTEYHRSTKGARSAALAALVTAGQPVGVLAYRGRQPVGWCSIAPRETYAGLERYRALPRLDATPVWSVVCFFVERRERQQGVTLGLLKAAVDYARARGARIVEAYPVQPAARLYTYMGSPATFRKAGFEDVTPRGQGRRIVRRLLDGLTRRRDDIGRPHTARARRDASKERPVRRASRSRDLSFRRG